MRPDTRGAGSDARGHGAGDDGGAAEISPGSPPIFRLNTPFLASCLISGRDGRSVLEGVPTFMEAMLVFLAGRMTVLGTRPHEDRAAMLT